MGSIAERIRDVPKRFWLANLAMLFGLGMLVYAMTTWRSHYQDDGLREATVIQREEIREEGQEIRYRLTVEYQECGETRCKCCDVDENGGYVNGVHFKETSGLPNVGEPITIELLTPAPVPSPGMLLGFWLILLGLFIHIESMIRENRKTGKAARNSPP